MRYAASSDEISWSGSSGEIFIETGLLVTRLASVERRDLD